MKKLKNNKNGNFNTLISREMQMLNQESKEDVGKYVENTLKGIKKPQVSEGENVPHS